MSALTGVCNWSGQPVSENTLNVLGRHSRPAGPDRSATVRPIQSVALQAHLLHFDELSTKERQPCRLQDGSVVTFDGRLDNRDDLLLTLQRDLGPDRTDAALVATAYAKWGTACIPRLVGEWSLAVWDAGERTVVLARDFLGNRPLYYLETRDSLAWATCLDALAAAFDLFANPDEIFISGRLTFGVPAGLTPFRGARALRAGHVLKACASGVSVQRYWTFTPTSIRYTDSRDYTEHLRFLLTEAVRLRLRSKRRAWAHLSGGWDSSSIVCLGDRLIRAGQVEAPALQPVSYVCSGSPESDESPYIEAVEQWCGVRSIRREVPGSPTFEELMGHRHPVSPGPRFELENPMWEAGDRIVLSGQLGDGVMLYGYGRRLSLLEPLHQGHVLKFLRLCAGRARSRQRPLMLTLAQLFMEAYLPQVRRIPADLAVRRRKRGEAPAATAARLGVTPELLALSPSKEEFAPVPSVDDFSVIKRPLVSTLYGVADRNGVASSDRVPDIWFVYPYAHRPLVEFALGVPNLEFWDPQVPRIGMRRGLADILPQAILTRTTKGNPSAVLGRAKQEDAAVLARTPALVDRIDQWELVRRGYVSPQTIAQGMATLAQDAADRRRADFLFQCIHLEAWLRTLRLPLEQTTAAERPGQPRSPIEIECDWITR